MKGLFWIGLVILILGIGSFFIGLPQRETHGVEIGDANIGVQTEHKEKAPPILSAVMIIAGAGMMIVGGRKTA
jgi:hypothetical protein